MINSSPGSTNNSSPYFKSPKSSKKGKFPPLEINAKKLEINSCSPKERVRTVPTPAKLYLEASDMNDNAIKLPYINQNLSEYSFSTFDSGFDSGSVFFF